MAVSPPPGTLRRFDELPSPRGFGAGPRVCPGRHLAGVEIRLVLSMLMREFSVSLAVDPASVREVMAFAMGPNGMPVMLRPRARDGVPTAGAMAGGNAADGGAPT